MNRHRPHTAPTPLLRLIATLSALPLVTLACGDALSTHSPAVKREIHMFLNRRSVDITHTERLVAYLFTPSEEHYVAAQPDFGPSIAVEFDSGAGAGCSTAPPLTDPVPLLWQPTYVFPVCLTLIPQSGATPGFRQVSIEVDSNGQLILQTAELTFVDPVAASEDP